MTDTFSDLAGANDFTLLDYTTERVAINIYGVLDRNTAQQNAVAIKPLEQSNFTSDSVQIKPYVITIRGVIYPSNLLLADNFRDLSDFIAEQIQLWRNYVNGTNLFILANRFSFGEYAPLKFIGINELTNTDLSIPEVTMSFMQVQTTTATSYSTTNTGPNVDQPMNAPQTSRQG